MRFDRFVLVERRRSGVLALVAALLLAACTSGGGEAEGASASPATESDAPAASGDGPDTSVPATSLTTFDGETVSFEDYRGTPMVVNFWASWCAPCVAEMPDLEAVHQAAGDRIAFVGINTQDTPEDAADMVEQTGVTYDLVRDPSGELSREFGVFGMPSTFFVGADGQIVGRHTGLLTRQAMVDALAEELGVEVEVEVEP